VRDALFIIYFESQCAQLGMLSGQSQPANLQQK
jgi:hypothetical protein